MCVYLLLSFIKFESGLHNNLQQILRILPLNLFEKRDLMALFGGDLDDPAPPNITSDVVGLKVNETAVTRDIETGCVLDSVKSGQSKKQNSAPFQYTQK